MKITIEIDIEEVEEEKYSSYEKEWWDKFKEIYGKGPNTGALYGYIFADIAIEAINRAGEDLTIDSFVEAMETLNNFEDPLKTGAVTFSDTQRQGTNISYFFQVQNERFEVISGPLVY